MTWPVYPRTNYRPKSPLGTLQQRIWRALRSDTLTCREIAARIGVEPMPVRASLYSLRMAGKVAMIGGGKACRYQRVPGERGPIDKRGKNVRSLGNLEPQTAEQLIVRKMRSLGKVWHPPRRTGIALEECWRAG